MSFQSLVLVMILAVLVGIFFVFSIFLWLFHRRSKAMSEFLKQFGSALGDTANNMDSGGLDQPVIDSITALGLAANALAKKTGNMLVTKGLNDQTAMLTQAGREIEVPPPPDGHIREVSSPEQLQHTPEMPEPQPGPEGPKAEVPPESGASGTTGEEIPPESATSPHLRAIHNGSVLDDWKKEHGPETTGEGKQAQG